MTPRRPRPRSGVAGFSLIEAIVAAVILGLALTALTNAQMSTLRGVENSEDGFQARALATLVADDIALVQRDLNATFDNFGCLNSVGAYADLQGCSLPNGDGFTGQQACSRYFFKDALPNLNTAALGVGPETGLLFQQGALVAPPAGGYRVDVYTTDHPDGLVPAGRARVVDVFVCYDDPFVPGKVREVRETRILFAESSPI